jgi:hypothetical protein
MQYISIIFPKSIDQRQKENVISLRWKVDFPFMVQETYLIYYYC